MILNVCERLGESFNIDPWVLRLIFLFLFFGYGIGLFVYIVLGIIFAIS